MSRIEKKSVKLIDNIIKDIHKQTVYIDKFSKRIDATENKIKKNNVKITLIRQDVSKHNKKINWDGNYIYYSQIFNSYLLSKYDYVYLNTDNIVHYTTKLNNILTTEMIYDPYKMYELDNNKINQIHNDIKKSKKRFIIIPIVFVIVFESKEGLLAISHQNALLFDSKTNELELFDPSGSGIYHTLKGHDMTNVYDIYIKNIKLYMKKILKSDKFTFSKSPSFFVQELSFQEIEEKICKTKLFDVNTDVGFCVVWSYWYIDMRLKYPDINSDDLKNNINELFDNSLKKITNIKRSSKNIHKIIQDLPICNTIREYTQFLYKIESKLTYKERMYIKYNVYFSYYVNLLQILIALSIYPSIIFLANKYI